MEAGASIRISPSWVPGVIILDISWDDVVVATAPTPQGPWSGQLALFGGAGTLDGQWDWNRNLLELELWVPVPLTFPAVRHLVATLSNFSLPAMNGSSGTGSLQPGLAPVSGALTFDWEVAAFS